MTDQMLDALKEVDWQEDLSDMWATVGFDLAGHVNEGPTLAVIRHRKWLKHLADKGIRIAYIESATATGQRVLSAWLARDGKPTKRLICKKDAEDLWLKR